METTKIRWADTTWNVMSQSGYSVSDAGEIRGPSGRILKPQYKGGYQFVMIRRRKVYVHAAVLEAFVGPKPAGHEARHLNDDQADNRLANLAWGTRQDNADDRRANGGYTPRRWSTCKLTEAQVQAIAASTESSRTLATRHGVSHTTVLAVKRGTRYASEVV